MKKYALTIKIVLSILLLVLFGLRMDHHVLGDVIAHISASAWVYATLLIIGQFCLLSARWMILLNIGRKHINFAGAAKITLASMLANLLLITSIGGIFVRVAMALQYGATLLKSFIATITDRLMTLAALAILAAIFLPQLMGHMDVLLFKNLAIWVGMFIGIAFLFTPVFTKFILGTLPQLIKSDRRVRYALRYMVVLFTKPQKIGLTILTSLIAQSFYFLAVYMIVASMNVAMPFWPLMAILPVITLIASVPLGIGGWGVREGAFIFGLGLLNIPMETAFLISVQIGLIGMLATLLAGIPMIMTIDMDAAKEHARHLSDRLRAYATIRKS